MTILIILICLSYIFGGIGYIVTIKRLDSKLGKNKSLMFILFLSWAFWLIILGFAYIMSEFEFWVKRQCDSRYKV